MKPSQELLKRFNQIKEDIEENSKSDTCPKPNGWGCMDCAIRFPRVNPSGDGPCPCHMYSPFYLVKKIEIIIKQIEEVIL